MSPPSLRALKAFAETTRAGSLAGAARALNVTPSAVSHLLRELEQSLAIDLTLGPGRLTEAGEKLGRRLVAGFDAIDAAVGDATQQSRGYQTGDLRVSALSSFLTLWLVPRLTGFQSRHRDIRLLLSTGIRPVDLSAEPFECAIRWGRGGWAGVEATLLFRDQPVVVINPRLLRANGRPQDLPRLAARTRPDDWPGVARGLGWADRAPVLTFETRALAVQAATAGMGAAVVDRNLVACMLADGLLTEVAPDPPVPVAEGHWFIALPDCLRIRSVCHFRDWLVAEASPLKNPFIIPPGPDGNPPSGRFPTAPARNEPPPSPPRLARATRPRPGTASRR